MLHRRSLALLPLAFAAALSAQVDRYELGLRLRAFERELATATDAKHRRDAFVELNRAVQAFFRLDLRTVASAVEEATWALRATEPREGERFARSLQLQLGARLLAQGDGTVPLTVQQVYLVEPASHPDLTLTVQVQGVDQKPRLELPVGELPLSAALSLGALPPGDHTLRWIVRAGAQELCVREQGLSIAADLTARLQPLLARDTDDERKRDTIEAATERGLVRMLQGMTRARAEETVLPGERLLREAEALAALKPDAPYYTAARAGQFWLRVPSGKDTAVVRLVVPESLPKVAEGVRVPLVLALHGAGGSENLFCDGYGDGAIVPLCAQRGWLLCAPRMAGMGGVDLPALIDALAARYPIDKDRVFVVGHSMGAMATVAQTMRAPQRFAAAAAISGGGGVRRSEALTKLPFFVGAGSIDFGRSGSRTLHDQLQRAGVASEWHEYADVEHLAAVQVALADVFAFFDAHLKR